MSMLNTPRVIIGAGGHARVLLSSLRSARRCVLFATALDVHEGQELDGLPVRNDQDLLELPRDEVELVNGLGLVEPGSGRRRVFEQWTERGYVFGPVVDPSATVDRNVVLEAGCQLLTGAVIQPGTTVGKNAIINTSASVDHDCDIGAHAHIAPGCVLSGGGDDWRRRPHRHGCQTDSGCHGG